MDDKGHMINSGKYDGMFYLKASDQIVEDMNAENKLFFNSKFTHSAPMD